MEAIALKTRNTTDRIALRGVRVRSRLVALGQKTTIEQTFVNLEDRAIEAVYTFPLPESAAVCHFEVITDDRVLTGQVEEAGRAEDVYDESISEGHGAFLLERNRPDIFTINVGNLKPKQAVTIRVTFVAELEVHDASIRLAFPTTVAPRYVTTTGTDPLQALIEGERINPPHVLHVPYGLSLEVAVDLGVPVLSIESPSHAIRADLEENGKARVTLASEVTKMDRDVVLTITLKEETALAAQVGRGPGDEAFVAVTLQPHFDEVEPDESQACEVFFVLDCSGSMGGNSIEQAKGALELCLRSLGDGDSFNICCYGSTFHLMSPELLAYSQETLDRAIDYVRGVDADLGGTELLPPLRQIFGTAPRNDRCREIVLLTDGQLGNEQAVIHLARENRKHNRIFTFGIGVAPSSHLVKGLARATGGVAEFASADERVEDKVLRTFSRMSSPLFTDIELDWGGAAVTLASPDTPAVLEGDSLTLLGRVSGTAPSECRVRMTTTCGPTESRLRIPEPSPENEMIATLWAHRRIGDLEASQVPRGVGRARRRENKQLIKLSKEFGVLCSQTSFVALEHRSLEERNDGKPAFRRVPVQLARGWGGIETLDHICAAPAPPADARVAHAYVDSHRIAHKGRLSRVTRARCDIRYQMRAGLPDLLLRHKESAKSPAAPTFEDPLLSLLAAQQAAGWFKWENGFDEMLRDAGLARSQCQSTIEAVLQRSAADCEIEDLPRIVDTMIVLFLLETLYSERQRLWKRAHEKARRYVKSRIGGSRSVLKECLTALEHSVKAGAT